MCSSVDALRQSADDAPLLFTKPFRDLSSDLFASRRRISGSDDSDIRIFKKGIQCSLHEQDKRWVGYLFQQIRIKGSMERKYPDPLIVMRLQVSQRSIDARIEVRRQEFETVIPEDIACCILAISGGNRIPRFKRGKLFLELDGRAPGEMSHLRKPIQVCHL